MKGNTSFHTTLHRAKWIHRPFGSFYVENEQVWKLIKEGKVKGFSVEGYFDYAAPNKEESYAEKKLKEK